MARQRKSSVTPPSVPAEADPLVDASEMPFAELPEPDPAVDGPDPAPETSPTGSLPHPKRRSPLPMVLGGVLAATIGGGGTFALLQNYPELIGLQDSAGLDQQLSDQDRRISELSATLAALSDTGVAATFGPDAAALIGPVETRISDIEADLKTLADRLAAIERRPIATTAPSPDLTAATQAMKEAEADALRLKEEASALARQAAQAEALARIEGALESGQPLTPGLDGLRRAGVDIPDALSAAEQGAPTLQSLRNSFPDAARDAIALSLAAQPQDTVWGRLSAFVQAQTGSRSLTPREGNDPDAILSRAEAALNANDLATAIAEIAALPPEGQGRMQEWGALAARRLAATEALAALRTGGQP